MAGRKSCHERHGLRRQVIQYPSFQKAKMNQQQPTSRCIFTPTKHATRRIVLPAGRADFKFNMQPHGDFRRQGQNYQSSSYNSSWNVSTPSSGSFFWPSHFYASGYSSSAHSHNGSRYSSPRHSYMTMSQADRNNRYGTPGQNRFAGMAARFGGSAGFNMAQNYATVRQGGGMFGRNQWRGGGIWCWWVLWE